MSIIRRPQSSTVLAKLKKMPPRLFEHLTFDLLTNMGLLNAEWRSPGADGGRDIQGVFPIIDLSEMRSTQSWYVECKRYATSVDWPTVRAKLAYAENHRADFLLMVTTGHLSPNCKEEIQRRDHRRERPYIRFWDAPVLELLVSRHPQILAKYGLTNAPAQHVASILPLLHISTQLLQTSCASSPLAAGYALEFAAAVLELIDSRLSELKRQSRIGNLRPFRIDRDMYAWVKYSGHPSLSQFDGYALRALFSGARFFFALKELRLAQSSPVEIRIVLPLEQGNSSAFTRALAAILPWSNFSSRLMRRQLQIKLLEA
jgi:hypothetical protein